MYEIMKQAVVSFGFGCVLAIDGYVIYYLVKAVVKLIRDKLRKESI